MVLVPNDSQRLTTPSSTTASHAITTPPDYGSVTTADDVRYDPSITSSQHEDDHKGNERPIANEATPLLDHHSIGSQSLYEDALSRLGRWQDDPAPPYSDVIRPPERMSDAPVAATHDDGVDSQTHHPRQVRRRRRLCCCVEFNFAALFKLLALLVCMVVILVSTIAAGHAKDKGSKV